MAHPNTSSKSLFYLFEIIQLLLFLYLFILSIDLMGSAFKVAGSGMLGLIHQSTGNPWKGLFVGIFVTSVIQSSSSTTSVIVALVGSGVLTLDSAIPIVIGANIGTTVTNTLVSFGFVGRKVEFERAFSASIVHDMFNICSTIILFPLEMRFHMLRHTALFFSSRFEHAGGFSIVSPLKYLISPVSEIITDHVPHNHILLIFAFILLFVSLGQIVRIARNMVISRVGSFLISYPFSNPVKSLLFGLAITSFIQSSSITTSLIIPIVGAGMLSIEQIYPYTLGANVGTTVTAILAALGVGVESAVAIAFSHLLFNLYGICIFFPLKMIPIKTAKRIGKYASQSKKRLFSVIAFYILLHIIPLIFILA
ncbi:MAG: Na/Pi symporter [Candidatus Latescibacteria bacterium]|nr:Na/Pi symporter [Candidatus Latescibacterota bacterium]